MLPKFEGGTHDEHERAEHHPLCSQRMSSLGEKRLDRLYALLEREQDPDTVAALRWAIFTLEQHLK